MCLENVVGIFWDLENIRPPRETVCESRGFAIANRLRKLAAKYGCIKQFTAYSEFPEQSSGRSQRLRAELAASGITLKDCAHGGRKEVADKYMIVDMMAFGMDNPANANVTIVLITDDHGYVYPMNILRARNYRVVVIATSEACAGLRYQEEDLISWDEEVVDNIRRPKPAKPICNTVQSPIGSLSSTPTHRGRPRSFTASTCEGSAVTLAATGNQAMPHSPMNSPNPCLVSSLCENSRQQEPNTFGSSPPIMTSVPLQLASATMNEPFITNVGGINASTTDILPRLNDLSSSLSPAPIAVELQVKIEPASIASSPSPISPTEPPPDDTPPKFLMPLPVGIEPWSRNSRSVPALTTTAQNLDPTANISPAFEPLVEVLIRLSGEGGGSSQVRRSQVGSELLRNYPRLYLQHHFKGFKEYTMAAAEQNIVGLGGGGGDAWIQLSDATQRRPARKF